MFATYLASQAYPTRIFQSVHSELPERNSNLRAADLVATAGVNAVYFQEVTL